MPICDVCLNLDWDLYPTPSTNETLTEKRGPSHPSHTLASSANRGCQLCLILHQGIVALRQYTASLLPPWGPWDFSDPCDVHIFLRPERSLLLYLDNSDYECEDNSTDLDEGEDDTALGRGYGISIEFFTSADRPAPPWAVFGLGGQVPEILEKRMYVQTIRDWLSTCTDQHTCVSMHPPKLPTRVLDLALWAARRHIVLVETNGESSRYMTLSHCWGESKVIETKTNTLSKMKQGIPWSTLSRTFQDAIFIASELGIRYLWIDSLCIIQDDNTDWERESSRMTSIYSNTYLNIAATCSGTSEDGFLRPRWMQAIDLRKWWSCPNNDVKIEGTHDGHPFEVFARFRQWGAHEDFFSQDGTGGTHIRSPLLARAWVFQELYLSPRTVHFHSSELIWECRGCIRCECTELANEIGRGSALSRRRQLETPLLSDPSERLFFWLSIVGEYCQLNLTRESDRLPALAGLASRFQSQTTGRYFAGIWENDLVRMLLWSLECSVAACSRSRQSGTPSWSWASITDYDDLDERGDNSPRYILVQNSSTSFEQDPDVEVLDVECTLDGINPFGQVSKGMILISGTVILSTLVRRRQLSRFGRNEIFKVLEVWHSTLTVASFYSYYSENDVRASPEIYTGADLIFEHEEDDTVIVTCQVFIPDVFLGQDDEIVDGGTVYCLRLGTSNIPWRRQGKLLRAVALCLVLRPSNNRQGAFERIGVMMCDPDSEIFQLGEHRIVELV